MKKNTAKVIPFNKKNAQAFADMIYSDKNGMVSFLKLCKEDLSDGKDGGRVLHCAMGEAYFTFVNRDMRKVLKFSYPVDDAGVSADSPFKTLTNDKTDKAIEELVAVAVLKGKPTFENQQKLATALADCVSANDDGDDSESFCARAEDVAEIWRKEVLPLLK